LAREEEGKEGTLARQSGKGRGSGFLNTSKRKGHKKRGKKNPPCGRGDLDLHDVVTWLKAKKSENNVQKCKKIRTRKTPRMRVGAPLVGGAKVTIFAPGNSSARTMQEGGLIYKSGDWKGEKVRAIGTFSGVIACIEQNFNS